MAYFFFKGGSPNTRTHNQEYGRRPSQTIIQRPRQTVDELAPETIADNETPVKKDEYKAMLRDLQEKTTKPEVQQIAEREIKSLKN